MFIAKGLDSVIPTKLLVGILTLVLHDFNGPRFLQLTSWNSRILNRSFSVTLRESIMPRKHVVSSRNIPARHHLKPAPKSTHFVIP